MRTLTDENAGDNSTMRELDIDLPKGAEVWVTIVDDQGVEILHQIMSPLANIRVVMPDADAVC